MNTLANVPTIEERARALPGTKALLTALHRKEHNLEKSVTVDAAWNLAQRIHGEHIEGMDTHVDTAREAGLIEERPCTGNIATRIALTDAGRDVIGVKRPLWMEMSA